jgi:hypothetical protein
MFLAIFCVPPFGDRSHNQSLKELTLLLPDICYTHLHALPQESSTQTPRYGNTKTLFPHNVGEDFHTLGHSSSLAVDISIFSPTLALEQKG